MRNPDLLSGRRPPGQHPRVTDANGSSTVERYDYLPFGGELLAGTAGNGRTTTMGYFASPDSMNPKFTGQMRDQETTLDWFIARAMSGAQGRFQSPDPGNAGADPSDPQTWNAYAYVANNPLSYTDPSGECFWCILGGAILDAVGVIFQQPELVAIGQDIAGIGAASSIGGAISGSSNNGPWSEQIPGLGGGSVNTGGVFGSGDAGPFVNNILQADATLGSQNFNFYTEAIGFLMSDPRMAAIIFQLQQSKRTYVVHFNRGGVNNAGINWDPLHSVYTANGGCLSPGRA